LEIGLIPGARIRIISRTPFGDVMTIDVEGKPPIAIGKEVAGSIWVFSSSQ